MKNILLTGGFGYIGSHTASILAEKKIRFIVFDNFSNCKLSVIKRLEEITKDTILFERGDICDTKRLVEIIKKYNISSIIHFAALKSVEDSLINPLEYFDVNISGTISLLKAMKITEIRELLFSSSATVYGVPNYLPIDEKHLTNAINPYGKSKLMVEKMLLDLVSSDNSWSITTLRYFNPIGAHPSNLIGDDPTSTKSKNLMPKIIEVARGESKEIKIFGNNYDTLDGTGIRDYIHIMDLANAHISALGFLQKNKGFHTFNIGTGKGTSVLELINTFEEVTGLKIPKSFVDRRYGDVPECYADSKKANNILGWHSEYDLGEMCLSSWEFSKLN